MLLLLLSLSLWLLFWQKKISNVTDFQKSSLEGKTLTKIIIIYQFTISFTTGIKNSHQMTKPRKLEMVHFPNSQQVVLHT